METKEQIINNIVKDLPISEIRSEMTDGEWYDWFEECWDKATKMENNRMRSYAYELYEIADRNCSGLSHDELYEIVEKYEK